MKVRKSKVAIVLAVTVLLMTLLFVLPMGASAASYTVLTESIDLRTKVTIQTEGKENVLIDSKGKKYTLNATSVLYSGGGVLQVYLNNTSPATINAISCKGNFQVMGGTGTLNVYSSRDTAIEVGYFDVHEASPSLTINAVGNKTGIFSRTFIEIAKGTVTAYGYNYGTKANTYYVIEKGGKLSASQKGDSNGSAVYGDSYIEVRDSSMLQAFASNGKNAIHAATYLSVLRGSNVTANGNNNGIYSGSYFSVLDNSTVSATGGSGAGMFSEKGYASIARNSKVTAAGNVGIRVYQYFSVLDGSTLNANGCKGNGAHAETQYVSVLRNSKMTGKTPNGTGVYAKSYMSVLTGSTLQGQGNIGLQSDEYIHTNGVGSLIQGSGNQIGVLAKGNGGDSIFADGKATIYGVATNTADGVGIRLYGSGQIAARTGAKVQGDGMRVGIENVSGYVEASNATLKGVSYNINSGYAAITASRGVKGLLNASIIEEYLNADVQMTLNTPFNMTTQYASVGNSIANIGNYKWNIPEQYVTIANNAFTPVQTFSGALFIGVRNTSIAGERVSLSSGATHQVGISEVSTVTTAIPDAPIIEGVEESPSESVLPEEVPAEESSVDEAPEVTDALPVE